jgi:hypothetical protein
MAESGLAPFSRREKGWDEGPHPLPSPERIERIASRLLKNTPSSTTELS